MGLAPWLGFRLRLGPKPVLKVGLGSELEPESRLEVGRRGRGWVVVKHGSLAGVRGGAYDRARHYAWGWKGVRFGARAGFGAALGLKPRPGLRLRLWPNDASRLALEHHLELGLETGLEVGWAWGKDWSRG